MQSRLLVYEYGTKNRRWFRPVPDLPKRSRCAADCAQHSAFPLGFLLVPRCDGVNLRKEAWFMAYLIRKILIHIKL